MASTKVPIELSSTPGIVDNSNATAITIDSSENVGIGTITPAYKLDVTASGSAGLRLNGTGTGGSWMAFSTSGTVYGYIASAYHVFSGGSVSDFGIRGENNLVFGISGTEYMRIQSGGQVVLTASTPSIKMLDSDDNSAQFIQGYGGSLGYYADDNNAIADSSHKFFIDGSERMRIDSSGNVGIGTTSISSPSGAAGPVLQMKGANPELAFYDNSGGDNQASIYYLNDTMVWHSPTYGGTVLRLYTSNGNLQVIGALSKGSGSFRIDHPLESKTDTHELVHSFIEGPQADLIYRGKVDLVDGSATVNIDTVAGMTEGTFVALNREVQCFTSNEADWDAVKGSVSGNILTIECQNTSSTATVSWLVIGERQDQHMYDTDWTDDNGKVIVEPLKGE